MSKGGSETTSTTQSSTPWSPLVQPYRQLINQSQNLAANPPQFYPGQTYVGALPEELQAFQQQQNFAQQMFGGAGSPYATALNANQGLIGGGTAGGLYGAVSPQAMSSIQSAFGGPQSFIGGGYGSTYSPQQVNLGFQAPDLAGGVSTPQLGFQAPDLTSQFGQVNINPSQFTPSVNPTVTANPNAAISQMLAGTPDYSGVAGSLQAAAQPTLDILNQQILPQLAARGIAVNNPTGGIKEANRIIPQVTRDILQQGAAMTEAERQRALGAQQTGANLATQAGLAQTGQQLQAYGLGGQLGTSQAGLNQNLQQLLGQYGLAGANLGLNAATTQAGLEQQSQALRGQLAGQQAGLGLQGATTQAQLGQNYQNAMTQLGMFNPQQQLAANIAQQNALGQQQSSALGLLGQTGNLGQLAGANASQGISNLQGLTNLGLLPSQLQSQYGQYQRTIQEAALQDAMNRFNYGQQVPFQMADWLRGSLTGIGQGLGTTSQTQVAQNQPSGLSQALGLAATIGSFIPGPWQPFAMGANALAGGKGGGTSMTPQPVPQYVGAPSGYPGLNYLASY